MFSRSLGGYAKKDLEKSRLFLARFSMTDVWANVGNGDKNFSQKKKKRHRLVFTHCELNC